MRILTYLNYMHSLIYNLKMCLTSLLFVPIFLVCIFVFSDYFSRDKCRRVSLEMLRRLFYMVKITEWNNWPFLKDIGHF